MRLVLALPILLVLAPAPALAQSAVQGKETILVRGNRVTKAGKPIPMSDWRVAETEHVLVYSRGEPKELIRIAHNLEKLHFLLSMLLNRVDQPDDTVKLRVTLIGDAADWTKLNLTNTRWQHGPYPDAFPDNLYYDPREDGAVLATPLEDQQITLERGTDVFDALDALTPNQNGQIESLASSLGARQHDELKVNEVAFKLTAEGRLYAGYAQHYLLTYFPATYPRWYIDGFGEIFATLQADKDGVIEYGQQPEGYKDVREWYGRYPLARLFDGSYLDPKPKRRPRWTPYHAWALTHLLFFSEEWKQPLHDYLAALGRGESPDQAAKALGDPATLQRELATYRDAKVPNERLVYPAERAPPPLVRRLTRSEATYVRGKLELGARIDVPPAPAPGADPQAAKRLADERKEAIERRDQWLAELRQTAARYADDLNVQLLLAEAECRSGNGDACLAAAEQVLKTSPGNAAAMGWKGNALVQKALAGPAADRAERLKAARGWIVRANRADTEAVAPLLAYYRSFADAGEPAPEAAVLGLVKASQQVPSAPAIRLALGEELMRRGDTDEARAELRPVVAGAIDTPEKPKAKKLLAGASH